MSYWDLQETLNTGVLITCFIHVSSIYAYPVIKWIKITCNSVIGQNWDAALSYFSFSLPFFFFSPFLLSHCSSIYRGRKTTVLWKSKWSISVPLLMRWVCLLIPNATKANQVSSPQSKHSFCREQQAQIWNNLELIGSLQIQNNTHTENVEYCANCAFDVHQYFGSMIRSQMYINAIYSGVGMKKKKTEILTETIFEVCLSLTASCKALCELDLTNCRCRCSQL